MAKFLNYHEILIRDILEYNINILEYNINILWNNKY